MEVNSQLDVAWVMERLKARGIQNLLVEGGGDMLAQLIEAGVLDEIHVTICPRILGGKGAPSLVDGAGFKEMPRLKLKELHQVEDELYACYEVIKEMA